LACSLPFELREQGPSVYHRCAIYSGGASLHFNATVAYSVHKGLWIGPNGYYLSQISNGKINGVTLHNSPEQVGAIGPGMVWNKGRWFFYANEYQELGARNQATGQKLVLRIEKVF
jgi:hypothetical protein